MSTFMMLVIVIVVAVAVGVATPLVAHALGLDAPSWLMGALAGAAAGLTAAFLRGRSAPKPPADTAAT